MTRVSYRRRSYLLVEDGIAEGLQNWFKTFINLYVDLIEPRTKVDAKTAVDDAELRQIEAALREQRLQTIYTVSFYIDSFFSVASAIIELQKLTRYLRKIPADVRRQSPEYVRALCDLLVMIGPVVPCLSSELWVILQRKLTAPVDGYDFSKSLFEQRFPRLPDDYPGKINALYDGTVFASMPVARSLLPSLTASDIHQQLKDNDQNSTMKTFVEQNGLKLDRLRRLGDYGATLIFERDPNMPVVEQAEPVVEKKKGKASKKKPVS